MLGLCLSEFIVMELALNGARVEAGWMQVLLVHMLTERFGSALMSKVLNISLLGMSKV